VKHHNNYQVTFWAGLISAFIILTLLLSSCGCNYHLKRIKAKCNTSVFTDTIWKKDTVFIKSVQTDSVFKYFQTDTILIREGRLTMKYFYNQKDSTVYLNGKCDTVFVIKDQPMSVTTNEYKPGFDWKFLTIICAIILLLILILRK